MFPSASPREHRQSRVHKTYCFPRSQSISVKYALRVLSREGVPPAADLINVYHALIRSILEYCCEVWNYAIPGYLSDELEKVQNHQYQIRNLNRLSLYQRRSQPGIWSCKCKFFSVYKPYKESISKEMNNDIIIIIHYIIKFA